MISLYLEGYILIFSLAMCESKFKPLTLAPALQSGLCEHCILQNGINDDDEGIYQNIVLKTSQACFGIRK